ncbi:MAG: hypothetical protein ACE5IL_11960 [Myxococcota bacterium]
MIAGGERAVWAPHWGTLESRAAWDCGYCLPGRNHGTVYVARDPRVPIAEMWAAARHYE